VSQLAMWRNQWFEPGANDREPRERYEKIITHIMIFRSIDELITFLKGL